LERKWVDERRTKFAARHFHLSKPARPVATLLVAAAGQGFITPCALVQTAWIGSVNQTAPSEVTTVSFADHGFLVVREKASKLLG